MNWFYRHLSWTVVIGCPVSFTSSSGMKKEISGGGRTNELTRRTIVEDSIFKC